MPIDFNIKPRHVGMFGAQGILQPLYKRQAQKMALAEKEREERSRFEQMKSLKELEAKLQQGLREPLEKARMGQLGASQKYDEYRLGQAQQEDVATQDFAKRYAAGTSEERAGIVRQEFARRGMLGGLVEQGQQYRPPTPTFIIDPKTGMPVVSEETGKPVSVPGTAKFLPSGRGSQVSRLNLADRTLKGMRARYNRDSKSGVRFDYSDIDWDSPAMKSLGVERKGVFGIGEGAIGGGRIGWMDNIMNVMATPATVIDSTGRVVPDETEYGRRANIIDGFRAKLGDESESSSKEKMKQLLHDMERALKESIELSSEEGQIFLSQPTQMMPQQRIVGEEATESPYKTWTP